MLHIFIDADACPVKDEVYRVASRCGIEVTLVANSWMRVPDQDWLELEIVSDGPDVADDWIVEHVESDDIVVTADILLADRCLKKDAKVIGTTGKPFTEENIGHTVAIRELHSELRDEGLMTGGPKPLQQSDRTYFLQQLDNVVQSIRRKNKSK